MKKYTFIYVFFAFLCACSFHKKEEIGSVNLIDIFNEITKGKSQLEMRVGDPTQFSGAEKICISATCSDGGAGCKATDHYDGSPLMQGSNYHEYYALTQSVDGYYHYGADSQYSREIDSLRSQMNDLMASFKRAGLIDALKKRGKIPALAFDIDNTLEFSGPSDTDPYGKGPAIQGMIDFVNQWCFKDGVDCYFITGHNCDKTSTPPIKIWMQANLNVSAERLEKSIYFARNPERLVCDMPKQEKPVIAYKDLIREALEEKENIFWLMSIGDQLTDSFGEHSGMKIRVPNQFFHEDISPNQYAPWGVGRCGSPTTIAPPRACVQKLIQHTLEYASFDYCSKQAPPP